MISALSGLENTAAALQAQRQRLDVVGQNIANAQVTRGADGQPYRRQQVVFDRLLQSARGLDADHLAPTLGKVEMDQRPARLVYQPGHPHADPQGMVAYPNINVHEEMVDLMSASRAFEANLAVVKSARMMAMQTLSLGKR